LKISFLKELSATKTVSSATKTVSSATKTTLICYQNRQVSATKTVLSATKTVSSATETVRLPVPSLIHLLPKPSPVAKFFTDKNDGFGSR
jgi:hypothetical protein